MLQHVSLELPAEKVDAATEFFALIGFTRVEPPAEIAGYVTWVERAGTQFHLIRVEDGAQTVPPLGHAAVVVEDFEAALARLRDAGHQVEESRRLWGAPRAFAVIPGGHRLELMASAPPASS